MLWGLRPVQLQAAHGLAVNLLRRQVHLGLLAPSERLPAERMLAEQLGVSRVTLREALRVLEAEGYLVVRRGVQGGAFICELKTLQRLATRHFGRDPAAAMRVFEFRHATEPLAARLAAARRTPTHLQALMAALDGARSADSPAALRRAESQFQLAIASASQNSLLASATEDALAAMLLPAVPSLLAGGQSDSVALRTAVLEAVRARDGNRAEEAMRALLDSERARLRTLPKVA